VGPSKREITRDAKFTRAKPILKTGGLKKSYIEEDTMAQRLATRNQDNEWVVILAGGDGTRLKSLTRRIAGDERPKQFCPVLGGATLLEETQRRAALELARERTLYVVNRRSSSPVTPALPRPSFTAC
jgi:hypothetical protein